MDFQNYSSSIVLMRMDLDMFIIELKLKKLAFYKYSKNLEEAKEK